jgi:alpha-aminoadipic semialdehyde synthase
MNQVAIGIRREDKNDWERRVPLIPSHIRELTKAHGLKFYVQPSPIRVFADDDFRLEGAKIQESLSPCRVILAVKEIPLPFFEEGKTYLFFSHTIKGQAANMPMLRKMIDMRCTLIEYEKIVDEKGRRLVFFGRQAGAAGMIDTLWALGRRIEIENVKNPFSELRQTYRYQSLVEAKEEIAYIGEEIRRSGLPKIMVPFICGFTGYGHVSQGAQEIFDLLPSDEIEPEEFADFIAGGNFSPQRVYKIVFREEHMVRPRGKGRVFELKDYYQNPEKYEPVLERFLPHLTVLVNGIYWAPKYPHFVTKAFIRELYDKEARPRLSIIGDISCDVEGGVECTVRATDPKDPVFVYDPLKDEAISGFEGRGPVIMAVDNLPAEISLESSVFFSQSLRPFIPDIAQADCAGSFASCRLPDSIKKAVILFKGEFTDNYRYMHGFLKSP